MYTRAGTAGLLGCPFCAHCTCLCHSGVTPPYTPYPPPHILHPIPSYTHPSPHTLHPASGTLHFTPCTLHAWYGILSSEVRPYTQGLPPNQVSAHQIGYSSRTERLRCLGLYRGTLNHPEGDAWSRHTDPGFSPSPWPHPSTPNPKPQTLLDSPHLPVETQLSTP